MTIIQGRKSTTISVCPNSPPACPSSRRQDSTPDIASLLLEASQPQGARSLDGEDCVYCNPKYLTGLRSSGEPGRLTHLNLASTRGVGSESSQVSPTQHELSSCPLWLSLVRFNLVYVAHMSIGPSARTYLPSNVWLPHPAKIHIRNGAIIYP